MLETFKLVSEHCPSARSYSESSGFISISFKDIDHLLSMQGIKSFVKRDLPGSFIKDNYRGPAEEIELLLSIILVSNNTNIKKRLNLAFQMRRWNCCDREHIATIPETLEAVRNLKIIKKEKEKEKEEREDVEGEFKSNSYVELFEDC